MTKSGKPLDQDVDKSGYDLHLERRFGSVSGSTELEERTGYSYEELQDLLAGGTPSSFVSSIAFSATDYNTVAWTSGSLNYQNGTKFTIAASNTGNIAGRTYIYFNPNISPTDLQVSTSLSDAMKDSGVLLAIAIPNADTTGKASIDVIGSSGGYPSAVSTSHLETGVMKVPLVMTPTSNTTALVNVNQADGTNLFTVDSTNARLGIGTLTPAVPLDFYSKSETAALRIRGSIDALTTGASIPTVRQSTAAWSGSVTTVQASDDTYLIHTSANTAFTCWFSTFNFSVTGTVISGIKVTVEAKVDSAFLLNYLNIRISGDGGSTWSNTKTTDDLTTSDTVSTMGNNSDLWGYAWTPAMFSNANFLLEFRSTFQVSNTMRVDHLLVEVFSTNAASYTEKIGDIYIGSTGQMIFDLTPGGSTSQFFDFRPEDNEYGLVIRESDGTGSAVYSNFYVTDAADDYLSIVVDSVADTNALNITASDKVGIGMLPTNKLDVAGVVGADNFISDVAIGTQPYATTSTTLNTNLNADLLDGKHKGVSFVATKSADYTLTTSDEVVVFTVTATATLPAAIGTGQTYRICNESVGGAVTIDGNSTDSIKGSLTQTLLSGEDMIITDYSAGKWV